MKPHKHAELIKAWADGIAIQIQWRGEWITCESDFAPSFRPSENYRIKPEPKPDVVVYRNIKIDGMLNINNWNDERTNNWKLTFDGETRELKNAEMLK